ncbi:hypothetical protein llap_9523 [Limosa lapponica baueri]|uniref:Uncharacterized protein n=1 Tax=Limosa lapponica baueri TaxID=1758121 RepID=A0A2I0U2C9_LIMLA|nr:hypothetical protein llap_9523 [Limosa lapponica baueri]
MFKTSRGIQVILYDRQKPGSTNNSIFEDVSVAMNKDDPGIFLASEILEAREIIPVHPRQVGGRGILGSCGPGLASPHLEDPFADKSPWHRRRGVCDVWLSWKSCIKNMDALSGVGKSSVGLTMTDAD